MQQIKYRVFDAYNRKTLEQLINDRLQEGWNTIGGVSVAIEVIEPPNRKALYFYTQAMTLITGEPVIPNNLEEHLNEVRQALLDGGITQQDLVDEIREQSEIDLEAEKDNG